METRLEGPDGLAALLLPAALGLGLLPALRFTRARGHIGGGIRDRGGRGRRRRQIAGALVLDDRFGHPRLAEQIARAREADRLLVIGDLRVELVDALLAILRPEARQAEQD